MKTFIVTVVTFVLIISCDEANETIYRVDPQLSSYVSIFYEQAAARGVIVDKNLIAEVKHIQGISQADNIMGQNYIRFNPEMLTLDAKQIEAHVYYRMAQVFFHINISDGVSFANPAFMFKPYDSQNKDAMFDNMFNNI